ncbi:hypothetical protein RISK_005394 [Rhodopirellula islandica]|uniref:Uncharacterized protein n=1 Tax=Rhodopirellula islandica TaxID=595434 RepID=A0A0J1B6V9_RHOIS|nr:hypothetical protein RISK_005394 [Rhodopirellula islandica]
MCFIVGFVLDGFSAGSTDRQRKSGETFGWADVVDRNSQ